MISRGMTKDTGFDREQAQHRAVARVFGVPAFLESRQSQLSSLTHGALSRLGPSRRADTSMLSKSCAAVECTPPPCANTSKVSLFHAPTPSSSMGLRVWKFRIVGLMYVTNSWFGFFVRAVS